MSRLERQLEFSKIAFVETVENLVFNGIAMLLALRHGGAWALVAATLARSVSGPPWSTILPPSGSGLRCLLPGSKRCSGGTWLSGSHSRFFSEGSRHAVVSGCNPRAHPAWLLYMGARFSREIQHFQRPVRQDRLSDHGQAFRRGRRSGAIRQTIDSSFQSRLLAYCIRSGGHLFLLYSLHFFQQMVSGPIFDRYLHSFFDFSDHKQSLVCLLL